VVTGMGPGQGVQMSEVKLAGDTPRSVQHIHNGVKLLIKPFGNEGGSVPTQVYIIGEGSPDKVTWRTLESKTYEDAIDEAKYYANQWVDDGMPSTGTYRPIDPEE
jgi:hypothetical protein